MSDADTPSTCSKCGAVLASDVRFCGQCGAPVEAAPSAPAGERKQVTVLFSDLSGYTALSERLDPEETGALMARIFARATEIVDGYGGRVEKLMGDAVMAVFGVAEAREDDPLRAVRTTLELHAAVDEIAAGLDLEAGQRLRLHSGINTGLIVTGELDLDAGRVGIVGDTINVASRLMSQAPSGEIWLGPKTATLVAATCECETVGEVAFKGKAEPLAVSRVVGLRGDERPLRQTRTRFVGRTEELRRLRAAVDDARTGRGTCIAIRAEAGGGKTRLFEEFRRELPDDVRWLEGRAYAYKSGVPYAPLIDLLNRAFEIREDDGRDQVVRKLETGLRRLLGNKTTALPVIRLLYGLDKTAGAEIDRESFVPRLYALLRSLLTALSERAPLVVCLQDLHWADQSSRALVLELVTWTDLPVVPLINFRPGFDVDVGAVDVHDLPALSTLQTGALVASMLDGHPPDGLVAFVEDRTEGNPFFAEEIVSSLLETGTLVRDGSLWHLDRPLEEVSIPSTVQGVLAARIDRLDETLRRLLREAAVIGREFLYDVVQRISAATDALDDGLAGLESAEMIREQTRAEYLAYIFKHALTQEVAYEGLLKKERQSLHARVGEAMEEVLGERRGEYAETLAYHFQRGGVTDKAALYLVEAGKKAFDRYATADADRSFREAFELLDGDRTEDRNRLQAEALIGWADCRYQEVNTLESQARLERAIPTVEALGDGGLLGRCYARLAPARLFALDLEGACQAAREAVRLGQAGGVVEAEAAGLQWLGLGLMVRGRIKESLEQGARAVEVAASLPDVHDLHYDSRVYLAMSYLVAGRFSEARRVQDDLLGLVTRTGHKRAAPGARFGGVLGGILLLQPDEARREADRGLGLISDPLYKGWLLGFKGFADILARRYPEARVTWDAQVAHHEGRPAEFCWANCRYGQGLIAMIEGDLAAGLAAVEGEIERCKAADFRFGSITMAVGLAEGYVRIADREITPGLGDLARNVGFVVRHALPAARHARLMLEETRRLIAETGMHGYDGMVTSALARLAARQGRMDEARIELNRCAEFLRAAGRDSLPSDLHKLATRLDLPTDLS